MISKTNATFLGLFFAITMLCSCSGSTPSGLSGKYSGTNSLGYSYTINFISSTDCIVSDPRRGQGPATYRVVNGHVLLSMPGGSVLCRLYLRTGFRFRNFTFAAYGTTVTYHHLLLPGRFDRFVSNLPTSQQIDPTDLIEAHTLFPLYRPFVEDQISANWLKQMRQGTSAGPRVRARAPIALKFCLSCMREDKTSKKIDPYWRRIHQVPEVSVCPIHEEGLFAHHLEVSAAPIFPILLTEGIKRTSVYPSSTFFESRLAYAAACNAILKSEIPARFHYLLSEYRKKLTGEKQSGGSLLETVQSTLGSTPLKPAFFFGKRKNYGSLHTLFESRTQLLRPLQHFLLCQRFGLNLVSELISAGETKDIFTKGLSLSVDREQRDIEMAEAVLSNSVQDPKDRPVFLSAHYFGRLLKLDPDNLALYPRTAAALRQVVETREKFALRSLHWQAYHAPVSAIARTDKKGIVFRFQRHGCFKKHSKFINAAWKIIKERRKNHGR
jgi:hypothetical protein